MTYPKNISDLVQVVSIGRAIRKDGPDEVGLHLVRASKVTSEKVAGTVSGQMDGGAAAELARGRFEHGDRNLGMTGQR